MIVETIRTVDVPRPAGSEFDPASRRSRRRALEALRALYVLGEQCTYRLVGADGSTIPSDQVAEQDSADVLNDLERLGMRVPPLLDALVDLLYVASSHSDRSRVAPALDHLLEYVDRWSGVSPARVAALFARLDPSRLVRAVGQTLLAATRLERHQSAARQAFLARFLEDLRGRGTPETTRPRFQLTNADITPPPTDERYGFTCATFVLAMLRSAVVEELLALDQWPVPKPQDTDDRWQRMLAKKLCSREASPEEAANVLAGVGAKRVLPADVAGGAMQPREHWPVGFVDARREGDEIAARLQ